MKFNIFRQSSKKPGEAPGTIVYVGAERTENIELSLVTYDQNNMSEEIISPDQLDSIHQTPGIKWLNVSGIHNPELIEKIGNKFDVHKLVLEDIVNTTQQPKIENFPDCIYVVVKMFYVDSNSEIRMEHINFLIKKNILISFQEVNGDVFEPVRKRLRDGRKKIRESNSDYLLYALIDAVVDGYYDVIRKFGEKMSDLKKSITHNASQNDLIELDKLYEEILILEHSVVPIQKILPDLDDFDSPLIHDSNFIYFRDLQDHLNQITLTIDAIKDKLSSMNEYYLSVVSNRTNEIMKTLALVATICVPITVIAGIYGMNFQNMPELESPIAYPIVLLSMTGVGISLLGYFKRKKWI